MTSTVVVPMARPGKMSTVKILVKSILAKMVDLVSPMKSPKRNVNANCPTWDPPVNKICVRINLVKMAELVKLKVLFLSASVKFLIPDRSVKACEENENCKNNGTCVENVCDCKEGSSGDYCEIVAGCDQLNCSAGVSDCALDEKTKEGVCICKKKSDIYLNDTCVACEKNENCENNGTCVENVCDCKEGSSGDYCEIVAGCDQLNCSAGVSDCALDEKTKEGVCICKKKSDIYLNDTCVGNVLHTAIPEHKTHTALSPLLIMPCLWVH
ncbi:neurogenic locus Notch protein [Trichonephila clavipes]|nr:neurogenic locus Notch protein [Trichonephila clavipes]